MVAAAIAPVARRILTEAEDQVAEELVAMTGVQNFAPYPAPTAILSLLNHPLSSATSTSISSKDLFSLVFIMYGSHLSSEYFDYVYPTVWAPPISLH